MPDHPARTTRRRFLAGAASAAPLLLLPDRSGGAGPRGANARLDVAFVGMGGRIQGLLRDVVRHGHNAVALCEVDQRQLAATRRRHGAAVEKARDYGDYRELLENEKSLDAVVIATPDHWHAPICTAAINAELHVYCEKPLTHTVAEAQELRVLANESHVVTQTGNQGSASPNLRRSLELIEADVFGSIFQVHVWHPAHSWPSGVDRPDPSPVPAGLDWDFWLGVAPERPYAEGVYHPGKWRGWYDFGNGSLGDFCCHGFNLPVRALQLNQPERIAVTGRGLGKESFATACTVRYFFPRRESLPPVELIFYTGGDLPPEPVTRALSATFGGLPRTGALLVGDRGQLSAGLWNSECYLKLEGDSRFLGADKHAVAREVPQKLPRVAGQIEEWLDACRGGPPTFSDFDHGGHLTEIGLAGVVALKLQRDIPWDGENLQVPGLPAAAPLIDKPMREKWL